MKHQLENVNIRQEVSYSDIDFCIVQKQNLNWEVELHLDLQRIEFETYNEALAYAIGFINGYDESLWC